MHPSNRIVLAALALVALVAFAAPPAGAVASHVVISEFATRGPSSAFDEFVELYNPTNAAVTLDSSWTLKARSNATTTYSAR